MIPFTFADARPHWQALTARTPLIHVLTNPLAIHFSANALLAVGASPAMVEAEQEVGAFTAVAANLLINIGTLHDGRLAAMRKAAQTAQARGKPWVLDPVAVGDVIAYRTDFARELLQYCPAVVRGNAAEILFLAGEKGVQRGADSLSGSDEALHAAEKLAREQGCVVVVTGARDFITDGAQTFYTTGGDVRQTRLTACGCTLSALVAAFVAGQGDALLGSAAACAVMKRAGDHAARARGMGEFAARLMDGLTWECYESI
ncbi:MAG: hydroxyethylthiazole kinase [Cardiobacteriaceae bacterium]|nr:hydroxyethylthiazole kinase [Cardiobacteriaceae bacterium]